MSLSRGSRTTWACACAAALNVPRLPRTRAVPRAMVIILMPWPPGHRGKLTNTAHDRSRLRGANPRPKGENVVDLMDALKRRDRAAPDRVGDPSYERWCSLYSADDRDRRNSRPH